MGYSGDEETPPPVTTQTPWAQETSTLQWTHESEHGFLVKVFYQLDCHRRAVRMFWYDLLHVVLDHPLGSGVRGGSDGCVPGSTGRLLPGGRDFLFLLGVMSLTNSLSTQSSSQENK